MHFTLGKNVKLTEYLRRHSAEEASAKEKYEKEYVINPLLILLSNNFQITPQMRPATKLGPKNSMDHQSQRRVLTTHRQLTNEIALPKKSI